MNGALREPDDAKPGVPEAGTSEADVWETEGEPPRRRRRRTLVWRWLRRITMLAVAIVAALIFVFFTVDLGGVSLGGRSLKSLLETEGTKFLKRELTVGRIEAHVTPGRFVISDLVIAGPKPGDRPFFSAKRVTVYVPWWTLFRREAVVQVELSGWRMVVERWADGSHIPNFKRQTPGGPSRVKWMESSVYASEGEFVYDDHVTPWSVVAPNLQFSLVKSAVAGAFVGNAAFERGTVRIQDFQPMSADFKTRFQLDGTTAKLLHLDLITDGAKSHIGGFVDFGRWPLQEYRINSDIDFHRMREIFFSKSDFRLSGDGRFNGVFKFWKDGRDLSGDFTSEEFGLGIKKSEWRLRHLHGALQWTSSHFMVNHADAEFLGGQMRLAYSLAPLGRPGGATATLTSDYEDVDLYRFTRQFGFTALEPQGRMRGQASMGWTNGKFNETMEGTGQTTVTTPSGEAVATPTFAGPAVSIPPEENFQEFRPFGEFPIAAETTYRFTAASLDFEKSWVATPSTFVDFSGHATGGPANLAFHVTSHDWQKSDRLFTAIMANFGRPTAAIPVGGRGTFDGTLTRSFQNPLIAGRFAGEVMRAWDVEWGRVNGDLEIENRFLTISNAVIEYPTGGRIVTKGRYSLGYRADLLDEINADIHVERMPLEPLRRAFTLTDWPIDGILTEADIHLQGRYRTPSGKGRLRIDDATAWTESFSNVTSDVGFGGDGSIELQRLVLTKGAGRAEGFARLSWENKSYVFNVTGTNLAVEDFALLRFETTPLTGRIGLTAAGEGRFETPAWEIAATIPDLYIGDEGIGFVRTRLRLANNVITVQELQATSGVTDRLNVGCQGTVATDTAMTSALRCSLRATSIDPYLKFVVRDMPLTRAIVTGSFGLSGSLRDTTKLTVDANLSDLLLTLFDYQIQNDGPVQLAFRENAFLLERVQLRGAGADRMNLNLSGGANLRTRTADVRAKGVANLGILQAFYPLSVTARGDADLSASLTGSFDHLDLRGTAMIKEGRFRHREMPHGLERINGPITMEGGRISVDGLRAFVGEGEVTFGGEIILDGYRPVEYQLRANGSSMHLRYPEGLRTTVDAELFLTGPVTSPVLSGRIDVLQASYSMRYQPLPGYLGMLTGAVSGGAQNLPQPVELGPSRVPIMLAIKVKAGPNLTFIENPGSGAVVSGGGDVDISGTLDRPIVTGRIELDRAEWTFSGYRYRLVNGSVDFSNPANFEPEFDLTAQTEVRFSDQTYRVTIRVRGTMGKLEPTVSSEPWLPEFQIVSMLLGETPNLDTAELRARTSPSQDQAIALRTAGVAIITSPLSATVGNAVQRATTIDTFQIQAVLGNEAQLNPGARLVLGKRVSNRIYVTYARTFANVQNEIILIEFDQNEKLSWVLSRNEDRTFALDFRLRYTFR